MNEPPDGTLLACLNRARDNLRPALFPAMWTIHLGSVLLTCILLTCKLPNLGFLLVRIILYLHYALRVVYDLSYWQHLSSWHFL